MDQIQAYVEGSPGLDPAYRTARAATYEAATRWVRLAPGNSQTGAPIFRCGARKIGGFNIRSLESAFGSDSRPFTQVPNLDAAAVDELLRALAAVRGWELCEITALSGAETSRFEANLSQRGRYFAVFPFRIRVIRGDQTYAQYLAGRGSSVNKNQRAHLNRATRDGFTFRDDLQWGDILRVLDARDTHFDSEDYSRTPEFRVFLQDFHARAKASGRLLEVGMFQGHRLVAYQLAFRTGPVLHMYQTAFDPAYAGRRPGALTLEKGIERGLEQGAALIDLMSDTSHLAHYASDVLELKRLVFFSDSLRGRLLAAAFRLKAALGR